VLAERRLLVVDDEVDQRALLARYLQQAGCRVYLADDGRDALHKLPLVRPDLVLMDVRMPGCDGLEACRLMRAAPGGEAVPVIFLTAAAAPQERVEGLLAGAVDYITKPYDFDEVRLRLLIHLRHAAGAGATAAPLPAGVEEGGDGAPLDLLIFRDARRQLRERMGEPPDLHELARSVGTNARRLNEAFRACAGVTAFEFLREERMQAARRLLGDTALEVQSIAYDLGFTTGANFATAFRERFGVSPTAFRRAWREGRPDTGDGA
jgi:DNA-binding response OmpR family regulator